MMVKSEACVIWKPSEFLATTYLRKLSRLKLPLTLTSPEATGQKLNYQLPKKRGVGVFLLLIINLH